MLLLPAAQCSQTAPQAQSVLHIKAQSSMDGVESPVRMRLNASDGWNPFPDMVIHANDY